MSIPDFQNRPLGNMVAIGAVTSHSCRIWIRADQPGRHRIEVHRADWAYQAGTLEFDIPAGNARDNTHCLELPLDTGRALEPLTSYQFRVFRQADGKLIGAGGFETSPDSREDCPERFSLALMSCNQPFRADGSIHPQSQTMLRAAQKVLLRHNCKIVFTAGDQMYADMPRAMSLFDDDYFRHIAPPGRGRVLDCSPAEVRRLYQRRYRHFFAPSEWREIHEQWPCYPIFDDHEILDNWGSIAEHQQPEWQSVWEGARASYCDYQASRVLENALERDHFGYGVDYGAIAAYVVDLRSNRRANGGGLMSEAQFDALEHFLETNAEKQALFLVLSVPAAHIPRSLARIASRVIRGNEDFSDRWSAPGHLRDRDRLLRLLHSHQQRHPRQPLFMLSGDIHIGCAHLVEWNDGTPPLYQFISSAISHRCSFWESWAAKLSIQMNQQVALEEGDLKASISRLPGTGKATKNPYGGLNLGIVEIDRQADGGNARLLLYGHHGDQPVCVYRSAPIPLAQSPVSHRDRRCVSQSAAHAYDAH